MQRPRPHALGDVGFVARNDEVVLTGDSVFGQFRIASGVDCQFGCGQRLADAAEHADHGRGVDHARHAEPQVDNVALLEPGRQLFGRLGRLECSLEVRLHCPSKFRQMSVCALAVEQQAAEFFLKLLDSACQRRLRDIALLRRLGEVQRPADGQEVSDLVHFHGPQLSQFRGPKSSTSGL